MKLADAANLSLPGRIAAAVVLGCCGIASVVWAFTSTRPSPVYTSPASVNRQETLTEEPISAAPPTTTPRIAARLDLNTATQAELELLPGVGPALSRRIVEYREKNGPFAAFEDLDKVSGIGPKMLEKIRPLAEIRLPSP